MSVQATYVGTTENNNAKGLLLELTFTGNYGTNGVGDLVNLAPFELSSNPTGVLDPTLSYNNILAEPPENIGVFSEQLGGSYVQLQPNAAPTLTNLGVRVFEPGGVEKVTGVAYTAAELAGNVKLLAFLPLQ